MAIGGSFSKPGMGGGAMAPLPSGGVQGIQQQAQSNVPYQGMFNGNPGGANNMGSPPSWQQQQNLGRYVPPTMTGGNGQWNTNQWNQSQGPYNYNIPGSFGSPAGNGGFAPMLQQFQQYMQPSQLSGNTFGFGNPFGGMGQGNRQFYGGMAQDYFGGGSPYQGGRGGGNGAPSYDEWRGGFVTDMMMRSPEESAAREADFRRMYEEEFGNQGGSGGGFGPPRFDDGGLGGDDFMDFYRDQTSQNTSQLSRQMPVGGMPPGKDGRPLQDPWASRGGGRMGFRGRGASEGSPAPIPAYDRPENRAYNMTAIQAMLGGF